MDADQVPERAGLLSLPLENPRPYLGRLVILQAPDGLIVGSAEGTYSNFRWLVVKIPDSHEQYCATNDAGYPEGPLEA